MSGFELKEKTKANLIIEQKKHKKSNVIEG